MPNFAYINQTNFRPFSYQEMLAPVLAYTQAHQAVEEAYGELESQANAIGSLINSTNDPTAYSRYKAIEDSIRAQADTLARSGLNPSSRKQLLDIRGNYNKNIVPINRAIARRDELAKEQRAARLQNPTIMYQRDLTTLSPESSLDRFLENPDYDYGESYSGALLTQQVSTAASNLAKELTNYGNGKRLDAFTKTFMQRHGYTREQVLDAINNPKRAESQPVLNAIVEQAIQSSNMLNWADADTINRAYNYARQGLWSAIGQSQVSPYEDKGAVIAAQEASQKRVAAYTRAINNPTPTGGYPNNPTPIISSRTKKNLKDFSHNFYVNSRGKIMMTWKGWKDYSTPVKRKVGKVMTTPEGTTILTGVHYVNEPSPFKKFMDSIGAKNIKGWQPGNFGNLWSRYVSGAGSHNGVQRTEYITDIKGSDRDDFTDQVLRAARSEGVLYGADMDDKSNKFVQTHNNLPLKKLNGKDYSIISQANSAYGRTLLVKNNKANEVSRYFAPRGINYSAENSSNNALSNMNNIEGVLSSGTLNGKPLTQEQRAFLENQYQYQSNNYGMINSQVGIVSETPKNSPSPYVW